MGDTKHDLMVKTCDPTSLACQCDFTTEDGCEAETGECSCTVWDLIEDNAELEQQLASLKATNAEGEKMIHRYVQTQQEFKEQLAAANAKLEGRAIREEECECASAPIDNVCRCCATFLRNELKAANARIAEARALWESEIHYMIRPDSDDEVENASADKHIIAFEKVLGGGQGGE